MSLKKMRGRSRPEPADDQLADDDGGLLMRVWDSMRWARENGQSFSLRPEEVGQVLDERKGFEETLANLQAVIDKDVPNVVEMVDGSLQCNHWAARVLAVSMGREMKKLGAENYLVIDFGAYEDIPALTVTIQKQGGLTPNQKMDALQKENNELRARIAELEQAAAAQVAASGPYGV
jgi:hypothetical protein